MSAETLRKAAETLRERAAGAQPSPWQVDQSHDRHPDYAWFVCDANGFAVANTRHGVHSEAAYIATMHPGVGLALADWLESVARVDLGRGQRETHESCDVDCDVVRALAVARPILDGAS